MYLRNASLSFVRKYYATFQPISSLFRLSNQRTVRFYCDKPENNVESNDVRLNLETIRKLERLALVDFDNEAGVKRLEEAVQFASLILEVNTENVKPMYTVLEDRTLELRPDVVKETNREHILRNAVITEEFYFVAPPGNKPLKKP